MKTFIALLLTIASVFIAPHSSAAEAGEGPDKVAEKFYAGYVATVDANKDTKAWVAKSALVTEKFKRAYARAMSAEEVDADPVLNAQDIPSQPFKAEKPEIAGDMATVVVVSSFGESKHKLKVRLVKVDGSWLLDAMPQ